MIPPPPPQGPTLPDDSVPDMIQVPTLAELGIEVCDHKDSFGVHDGFKVCYHCGANWDGEWRGGRLDRQRLYNPRLRRFVWVAGPVQMNAAISVKEWREALQMMKMERR